MGFSPQRRLLDECIIRINKKFRNQYEGVYLYDTTSILTQFCLYYIQSKCVAPSFENLLIMCPHYYSLRESVWTSSRPNRPQITMLSGQSGNALSSDVIRLRI